MPGRLSLRLLGDFEASRDDLALTGFAYDKVRALLAFLVVEAGTAFSRERLADLLWPSIGGDTARNNLRHALHNLRQTLGPDKAALIQEGRRALRFDTGYPAEIDLRQFNADISDAGIGELEAQVSLYRGTLLDGLGLPDTPEFDHWLHRQRECSLRRALELHQRLADQYARAGDTRQCCRHICRQLELAPWQEASYRDLMRLHAEAGQAGEALQVFETCRQYLASELGVAPDPATEQLAARIRLRELPETPRLPAEPAPPEPDYPWRRLPVTVLTCLLQADKACDPDRRLELLAEPREHCSRILAAAGGHCVTLHQGELKAYFGYPAPHEHAPRLALAAAVDIAARLRALANIEFSIGVDSGWMLADSRYVLPDAAGELSRLSRELAGRATCAITVSPAVRAATEGYFRFTEYLAEDGDWNIEVASRTGASDRLAAAREADRQLTPLSGRKEELAWLRGQWNLAIATGPRRVLISGEAGIGKSRLMQAATEYMLRRGCRQLDLYSQQDHRQTPYFPLTDYFRRRFDDQPDAPVADRLERLQTAIAADNTALADCQAEIAALLSLPTRFDAIADRAERRRALEAGVLACLGTLCGNHAILLTLEDAHWTDPSTLDLLDRLGKQPAAPLFWLATSRAADSIPAAESLPLRSLDADSARRLAARASGGDALAPERIAEIVGRTDGVPLYIEQMVRSVVEGDGAELPPNLGDLLLSRLDSLGAFRPLAQLAAVIGREFDQEMLDWLRDDSAIPLSVGLARMCSAQLVQHDAAGRYAFRHALIRDAAYQSLAAPQRRAAHARLAAALRQHHPQRVAEQPQLLAHHLDAAAAADASAAWLRAGLHMDSRSAQREAAEYYRRGLAALGNLSHADSDLEFRLNMGLGNALVALRGYGSEESQQAFERAKALSAGISDHGDLFQLMWGLWLDGRSATGERPSLEFTEKLRAVAERSEAPDTRVMLDYAYGNNYFWLGQLTLARRHFEQAIAGAVGLDGGEILARYGEHGGITARAFLSWTLWLQGDTHAAIAAVRQAIAEARGLGHIHTLAYALTFDAVLQRHLGYPERVLTITAELMDLAVKHDLLLWQAAAAGLSGWALVMIGNPEGLALIHMSIEGARKAMLMVETTFLAFLAEALYRLERYAETEAIVDECIAKALLREDLYFLADFHRLKGELQLARYPDDPRAAAAAELSFAEGMAVAERQGARTLALRLATSQARLWSSMGRRQEAASLLASHTAHFHAQAEFPDSRRAFELLAQLGD